MHELTALIKQDMKPALGVTEPGAIAFCVAKAREYVPGELKHVHVSMNSGLYKNAFTCGIPNAREVGAVHAAALGFAAGNASLGLEALAGVTEEDDRRARSYVEAGMVSISLSEISSRIHIRTRVETEAGVCDVTVWDTHTNVTRISVNGNVILEAEEQPGHRETHEEPVIHRYTLEELVDYVRTVPLEEIAFTEEAYRVNMELFQEGLDSPKTSFARRLLAMNGGVVFSDNELRSASLLCNAAIEARVIGLNRPAMSITGSGAHGIIATLPLYAVVRKRGLGREALLRATMLSYLVCTYIKEYSGRLSAFCGCGIAAGTGMAAAVCFLRGGGVPEMARVINNMASSITGMICDGGNQGCVMKGIAACAAAFESVELALAGAGVDNVHGINGKTPEETMRNMGRIADPGMTETEKTILEIQSHKEN